MYLHIARRGQALIRLFDIFRVYANFDRCPPSTCHRRERFYAQPNILISVIIRPCLSARLDPAPDNSDHAAGRGVKRPPRR